MIEAVSNDLRANITVNATDVEVVLEGPRVIAAEFQHYVNQGGMELVTMTPSGSWKDAGVKVGSYTFRSFPLPGKDLNGRFDYQFTPHDVWDWDATEPLALIDSVWEGQARKLLLPANRNGFLYVLDHTNGKPLLAKSSSIS